MSLFSKFFTPKPRDAIAAARIKQWVRDALEQDPQKQEDITVTVSEIDCNDAACPGTETIILIMRPYHTTKAIKLSKLMDMVEEDEVIKAVNAL
jgi:translation elongation factor EF-Tu-like GTPase